MSEDQIGYTVREPGTLYGDSPQKKKKIQSTTGRVLLVAFVVLLMLGAVRCLTPLLAWNVTRMELTDHPINKLVNYRFYGLSSYETMKEKITKKAKSEGKSRLIFSYFDLIHPNVFMIMNLGEQKPISLGPVTVYPKPGFSVYYLYQSDVLEKKEPSGESKAVFFGEGLFPSLLVNAHDLLFGTQVKEQMGLSVSFMRNPPKQTAHLHILYTVYFFVPLFAIFLLSSVYNRSFYIAFFYYIGLFLLFDYRRALFTDPFHWLMEWLNFQPSATVSTIAASIIAFLLIVLAFFGIFGNREKAPDSQPPPLSTWAKGFIVFFILLPLVLRF